MIQRASSRGRSSFSTAELHSFPRSEPHSLLQQTTPRQHSLCNLCADSSNPSLWKVQRTPQNHILTQGQQDQPLAFLRQELAAVPHCLYCFCSFSPHPDNARGQVSKGLPTNHMITEVRGSLQKQGREETEGKQQEKEKGHTGG